MSQDPTRHDGEGGGGRNGGAPEPGRWPPARRRTAWFGYGWAVVAVGLAAGASWLLSRLHIEPSNLVGIFLLAVTYTAVRHGAGPSVLASLLGVAVLDFFFVEPHLTFAVRDTQYLLTFAVLLGVGLLISRLTATVRNQAEEAGQRERRTAELYALSRRLTRATGLDEVVRHAARHIAEALDARVAVFLADASGRLELRTTAAASPTDAPGLENEAQRTFARLASADPAGTLLDFDGVLYLPLLLGRGPVGVLVVQRNQRGGELDAVERGHLEAIANHVALAIERARLVEAAQHAAVEVEAEQARSSLLASVSHDLRTPLATIAGSAAALLEAEGDAATRRELAESVRDEAQRLERYVEKLLAMTRLDAGQVKLHKEWQPIEDSVVAALARVERELGDREVRLSVPADLPMAPFDAPLVEQVLVNLLENACRHAGPQAAIEVNARSTPGALVVEVADDGVGLEPGSEQRVFEKFYRAGKRGVGAGLGLAICVAIVRAHGGSMHAANRPAGGASFTFEIPIEGLPPAVPGGAGEARLP